MTTENRRKEEKSKAKTEESKESFEPPPNSAMVDKAEREKSILPSGYSAYIATIGNVVGRMQYRKSY